MTAFATSHLDVITKYQRDGLFQCDWECDNCLLWMLRYLPAHISLCRYAALSSHHAAIGNFDYNVFCMCSCRQSLFFLSNHLLAFHVQVGVWRDPNQGRTRQRVGILGIFCSRWTYYILTLPFYWRSWRMDYGIKIRNLSKVEDILARFWKDVL